MDFDVSMIIKGQRTNADGFANQVDLYGDNSTRV